MAFLRFPSFQNASDAVVSKMRLQTYDDINVNTGLWYAFEKIHGCNYSITYPAFDVKLNAYPMHKPASRSNYLTYDAPFHNHAKIMQQFESQMNAMVEHIRAHVHESSNKSIHIFGELFGGTYPHSLVTNEGSVATINEVYYSPRKAFRAFSLFFGNQQVNIDVVLELFEKFHIPHLKPMHMGPLSDMLKLNSVFLSKLYTEFGENSLNNNEAEGYVLMAITDKVLIHADTVCMLKLKNPKHAEKQKVSCEKYTNELEGVDGDIDNYVSMNRLGNVLSKDAKSTNCKWREMDKKRIAYALVQDALVDMIKDFKSLSKQQTNVMREVMLNKARTIVDNYVDQAEMGKKFSCP